ncbi:sulfotransferase domain-containing protein [Saccharopolyspora karakumensis]|uniref:sulfotransferase domain-containing protein n=1 Tax=Saccharopolyspora karakumensis TaxID=2530386 RepID=UPI001A9FA270|nr:sulfotransferase domain-containing protein [Saccharopolyspora karakumensis]
MREWLLNWCTPGASDEENRDIAAAELHHPLDAWNRRADPNVRLMHYDDLAADLEGQPASLAAWLGIPLDEANRRELVKAATFDEMKARADGWHRTRRFS